MPFGDAGHDFKAQDRAVEMLGRGEIIDIKRDLKGGGWRIGAVRGKRCHGHSLRLGYLCCHPLWITVI